MSASPVPPDTVELAAPLLFGVLWNWTLFGVLVVQIYVYSYNFSDDRKILKLLVYSIFLLETLQTALSGADVYFWFASGFGQVDRLRDPYAASFDVPIIGSIVSGIVQFFFVYRVWVLSNKKSWLYCVLISVCATLDTVGAFAGGIFAHVSKTFISGRSLQIVALTWLSGNTATDLLIVGAMLYYLTRRRNADTGPWCNHAVVKIVRLTIETNIMTTTNSVIALLLIAILPHKFYYTCPTAILGKLYSNTLLFSLNNRISIRELPRRSEAVLASRTRPNSTAKDGQSVVLLERARPPYAFKERKQSEETV
ncbi:hypothetical protein BGY98DRAFT_276028 [Russula aff. rugulosa BPL654]|nr:hypothetical protein BGY98DRAFT_276028 [Russula aff. rugulosa BPL654]